jgi:hypothetical protein
VDAAGARALARRLAEGSSHTEDEVTLSDRLAEAASGVAASAPAPVSRPPLAADSLVEGVLYLHPRPLGRRRTVWVFVRAADGRLHRSR